MQEQKLSRKEKSNVDEAIIKVGAASGVSTGLAAERPTRCHERRRTCVYGTACTRGVCGEDTSRTVENRDVFAGAPMDGFTAFRQGTAPVETPPRDEQRSFMNTSGS